MQYFHNDYNEICHPAVIQKLSENMGKQMGGYGEDTACNYAAAMIRNLCKNEELAVHFLVGGTQTNLSQFASSLINRIAHNRPSLVCATKNRL